MIWVEIVCDRCADVWTDGLTPARLRAGAKRAGWWYTPVEGEMKDYCPRCAAAIRAERRAVPGREGR